MVMARRWGVVGAWLGRGWGGGIPSAQEVDEHVAERLEVVASALLLALVCVDAHVPCRAREAFVFAVLDVLLGLGVDVFL